MHGVTIKFRDLKCINEGCIVNIIIYIDPAEKPFSGTHNKVYVSILPFCSTGLIPARFVLDLCKLVQTTI